MSSFRRHPRCCFSIMSPWFNHALLAVTLLVVGPACKRSQTQAVEPKPDAAVVEVDQQTPASSAAPAPAVIPILNDALASRNLAPSSDASTSFSIMTWNLEWFFDDSRQGNYSELATEKASPDRGAWNWRRDAVAAAIASVEPSIVAVQEAEGRRVLWYLTRALEREHNLKYDEFAIEGTDHFTEQDVGLLSTQPVDVASLMIGNVTSAMKKTKRFGSVPKHIAAIIEVPVGDQTESILIVNVHFRSGVQGASIRAKQAATLNEWIRRWRRQAEHLVITGDFNTEQTFGNVEPESEMDVLISQQTDDPSDDLIDLHSQLDPEQRGTHLLPGRQFDRILVSRSLFENTDGEADLVLKSVQVRPDLCIRGDVDSTEDHWERYWDMDEEDRDLSDHYPVLAEFEVR